MKSEIENFVIRKVKFFRLNHKMSQADLAFKLGVSYGFIGRIESDKYPDKYNLNHINKLSIIFNCSPKDFLPENACI